MCVDKKMSAGDLPILFSFLYPSRQWTIPRTHVTQIGHEVNTNMEVDVPLHYCGTSYPDAWGLARRSRCATGRYFCCGLMCDFAAPNVVLNPA